MGKEEPKVKYRWTFSVYLNYPMEHEEVLRLLLENYKKNNCRPTYIRLKDMTADQRRKYHRECRRQRLLHYYRQIGERKDNGKD